MNIVKITIRFFLIMICCLVVWAIVQITRLYPAYNKITRIEFVDVDPNFKIFVGYGANTGILKSNKPGGKVLVIDTKFHEGAKYVADYVKQTCWDKKVIIVNTQFQYDHVGGNKLYEAHKVISGSYNPEVMEFDYDFPSHPDEIVTDKKVLKIGNEKVTIINPGPAYTNSNLIVYLHKRKVLFTGDLVFNNWHPYLSFKSPTNINRWIGVLDKLLCSPKARMVVPGHGSITSRNAIYNMRVYLKDMKTAVCNPDLKDVIIEKYEKYFNIHRFTGIDETLEYMKSDTGFYQLNSP